MAGEKSEKKEYNIERPPAKADGIGGRTESPYTG